ncbi:MAG: metal ABC transporter permease [Firmicutes bacterium]|nr:metal ABC transporter permease [Bacillota bacterium]
MLTIFKYQFMQNALIAGLLVGMLCSMLSLFVVLRRMAFIGEGIAHAAFGGIAFALLFNLNLLLTANIFCIILAVLIGFTSKKGKLSEDSSIGLFLTTSMALGVILLKLRKEYTSEVYGYLFGNILAVSRSDVIGLLILSVLVVAFIVYFYKQIQYFIFDEDMAKVAGIPVKFFYYSLLVILAMVIVMSVQVVGVILVSALIIIPATVSLLVAKRFTPALILSVIIGIFSTFSGLITSYYAKLPSGAVIVITLFLIFVVVLSGKKVYDVINRKKQEAEGQEAP